MNPLLRFIRWLYDVDERCKFVIPGIGRCQVLGMHEVDGHGRDVHVRGAIRYNG